METEIQISGKSPNNPLKKLFKIIFWLFVIFIFLIGLAITLVFVYEDEVKEAIIGELNKNLKSEVQVDPKNIDLTFIKSFPKCALEFKDVLILEALEKKQRDTLIFANDIFLMFNLKDIWNKNYTINKIHINKASCYLQIDKKGKPNYIFWKSTGKKSDKVKFSLQKIELNEIKLKYKNSKNKIKASVYFNNSEFSGNFGDEEFSLETKGIAEMDYLILNKNKIISEKKIKYNLDLRVLNSNYTIEKAELALNNMYFALEGSCNYSDSLELAKLDFKGKNLNIASLLSLLPEKYAERVKDYSSEGEFYCKGNVAYKAGQETDLAAEFGIKNATVVYKPNGTMVKNLNLLAKLKSNDSESVLNFQNISAELGKNVFNGFCLINNLSDPYLNLSAFIKSDLNDLNSFWPIDTVESISGNIDLSTTIKGKLSELKKSAFSQEVIAQGNASLKDIKMKIKGKENEINISEGAFEILNRSVKVNNFKLLIGKSDIELNGELPGFVNYLLDAQSPLIIVAGLKSNNLIIEDVLYGGQSDATTKKVNIPSNLNFKLLVDVSNLSFVKFSAQNIKGDVVVANQKIMVNDLCLNTMDGKVLISAVADASGEEIVVKAVSDLSKINMSKLFYQCNSFGQNTLNEKHLNGYATATLNFSGNWSKELNADLESVTASGNITIEQGRLVDFKPLMSLSKYVEVNELKDIKFQSLQSNFEIKQQVITIPKTSIKNSAMNIELWGKHTFRNEIDYHVKLSLSELLANKKRTNKQLDEELNIEEYDSDNKRSVFLVMTGTVDNPIIKYDRKGLKQKLGEDLKAEKQTLKQILKEEFGLFKKDSTIKEEKKDNPGQHFKIEFSEKKENKSNNLQPKKKEDDDDDDF